MQSSLKQLGLGLVLLSMSVCVMAAPAGAVKLGYQATGLYVQSQKTQAKLTPATVLAQLKAGNKRFVANKLRHRRFDKIRALTAAKGQFPKAVLLNCVDSRSNASIVFDQGLGNIFAAATAGAMANRDVIGSMEFATTFAGSSLIVVMGHTHCGAVATACVGPDVVGKADNLKGLLTDIQPAVDKVKAEPGFKGCDDPQEIDKIAKQNVIDQMKYILANSKTISQLVDKKQVGIVGAMHDIKTGEVSFFNLDGSPA